jgi:hypothetical protein
MNLLDSVDAVPDETWWYVTLANGLFGIEYVCVFLEFLRVIGRVGFVSLGLCFVWLSSCRNWLVLLGLFAFFRLFALVVLQQKATKFF